MSIVNAIITAANTTQVLLPPGNRSNVLFQCVSGGNGYIAFGSNVLFTANATTVDVDNDTITTPTPHGLGMGQAVLFSSAGSLPAPLNNVATYFVLPITPYVFKVCSTAANVITSPPTTINLTTTGSGTTTVRVTAQNGIGIFYPANASIFFNAIEYPDICKQWSIYAPGLNDKIILLITDASEPPYGSV